MEEIKSPDNLDMVSISETSTKDTKKDKKKKDKDKDKEEFATLKKKFKVLKQALKDEQDSKLKVQSEIE